SRLASELLGRIRQLHSRVEIWIGRGDPLRAGSPLGLLGQALRGALDIHESEPLEARQHKLRARVAARFTADEAQPLAEFLGALVGAPLPSEGSAPLRAARQDAQLMDEQIRRAWVNFLRSETAERPVLFLLEDLHWSHVSTVRFIDTALRELNAEPWMVLA